MINQRNNHVMTDIKKIIKEVLDDAGMLAK